jgi:hypothetical protein
MLGKACCEVNVEGGWYKGDGKMLPPPPRPLNRPQPTPPGAGFGLGPPSRSAKSSVA